MSRYLRLLGLFLLAQACVLVLLLGINGPSNNYMAAVADKSRLLATAPSPRIVLVGASNLAFGIDSPLLKKGLRGRYHPVNLGLQADLGLRFELNQALAGLRPGDIVVLSPEYGALWGDLGMNSIVMSALLYQPGAWTYVPRDQRLSLFQRAFDQPLLLAHDEANLAYVRLRDTALAALGRAKPISNYTRAGFNEYGDQTSGWNAAGQYAPSPDESAVTTFPSAQVDESARALRGFIARCHGEGVAVVYSYPPIPDDLYRTRKSPIERTSRILESRLPIPFLNRPADAVFAPGDFLDTPDHLRGPAVQERTRDLVRDLLSYLATRDQAPGRDDAGGP